MSLSTSEIINRLSNLQPAIWQGISLSVSEAVNAAISFENPLALAVPTSQAAQDYAAHPYLIVQFAFADTPDQNQVFLVPQELALALSELMGQVPQDSVDENIVAEIRPALEAIVQGLCVAMSNARNDAVVASGLTIRFAQFQLPPNMEVNDEVIVTNIGVSSDELNGTLMWFLDRDTSLSILGVDEEEAAIPAAQPFETFTAAPTSPPAFAAGPAAPSTPDGLELLLDIPLEVSAELGRVKMQVREVIDLGAGSIVEIDKAAGEPVDVLVNGRLVARGEVVVIEDNFGVRITEILSPQERLARLNEAA